MPLSAQSLNDIFYNTVKRALKEYDKGNADYIYLKKLGGVFGKHLRIPIIFNKESLYAIWNQVIKQQKFANEKMQNKRANSPLYSVFNISNEKLKLLVFNDQLRLLTRQFGETIKQTIKDVHFYQSDFEMDTRFTLPEITSLNLQFYCLIIPQADIDSFRQQVTAKGKSLNDQELQQLIVEKFQENINNIYEPTNIMKPIDQNIVSKDEFIFQAKL